MTTPHEDDDHVRRKGDRYTVTLELIANFPTFPDPIVHLTASASEKPSISPAHTALFFQAYAESSRKRIGFTTMEVER
jgi:hypothetical protein